MLHSSGSSSSPPPRPEQREAARRPLRRRLGRPTVAISRPPDDVTVHQTYACGCRLVATIRRLANRGRTTFAPSPAHRLRGLNGGFAWLVAREPPAYGRAAMLAALRQLWNTLMEVRRLFCTKRCAIQPDGPWPWPGQQAATQPLRRVQAMPGNRRMPCCWRSF